MKTLTLLAVICLFVSSCQSPNESTPTLVSSEEMKKLMDMDSIQLIDVRSLEEFREGHLKGAQNLIYDNDFAQKISQLDKSKPVAVYCKTGRRSEECANILKKAGFKKVYDLKGGLSQWKFEEELVIDSLR
ncbi:rhodanese-like domain-containing protein [Psychroflexus gondwanensis]|jgi:rhodanese-related sulfurtransferase|uniref:rhodanese-like domain-containing protein n=1 Tax=Psychroflexus gondwanensis TaxID=251 RepID=UPI0011BD5721|nr:rhodanese-like domain-containing protein [Psychroflexus gondwanensis]TXE18671.1 rhodanese-like domain-containing protein [Psychroflexus gondwanensis]